MGDPFSRDVSWLISEFLRLCVWLMRLQLGVLVLICNDKIYQVRGIHRG